MAVLGLAGCPLSTGPIRLGFNGSPRIGEPDLTVSFHGWAFANPPYYFAAAKLRDDPNPPGCDQYTPWRPDPRLPISVLEWIWDFGDCCSPRATGQDVTHEYTAPGCYTVTLTVTLSNYSVVTVQEPCYVQVLPPGGAPKGDTEEFPVMDAGIVDDRGWDGPVER